MLIGFRNFGHQRQAYDGNRESILHLLKCDFSFGVHLFDRELGLAQDQGQGHGKAAGMRGAD